MDDRITATALYRAVLLAFGLLAVVLVFPELTGLLLLLMLVAVVSVPLSAGTDQLARLHMPRGVAAPLLMLAALGVFVGIIALLVPVFTHEGRHFIDTLPRTINDLRKSIGSLGHQSSSTAGTDVQGFVSGYTNHPERLLGPAASIGAGVAGALTALIALIITAIYSAVRPDPLVRGAVRLVPPNRRGDARRILSRLAHAYVGWLGGLVAGMAVLFVVTYVGLRLVNLPYAIVFATLTAVAMIVPYFGALISSIPPILFALTISPGKALIVAGIYLLSHQVEGHLIEPLVMARALHLHPAMVAIGVLAVERLFGPIGLIVAVPILVTVKILVEELWVRPIEERAHGREPPPNGDGDGSADGYDPTRPATRVAVR